MTVSRLPPPYQPLGYERDESPLIVLEGVSGVGKSTLRAALVERLGATGIHTLHAPHADWSGTVNARLRPLPQFAFYLSGLLHVSDSIRQARVTRPVVADRYVSSVVACHSAVHRVPVATVAGLLEPYRPYLSEPTRTFYLRCSEGALRDRLAGKSDLSEDDVDLLTVKGRLSRLLANFASVAKQDQTAVVLETDDTAAEDLADLIVSLLEKDRAESDRH
ncbi:thymidylate kinase [Streptomyces sp. NPDC008313]|uniref:thymidylate kinase n=1 Tax=Streptomyces sp. NPDC008313 TaxID=3364826 RepID=UPI0036E1DB1C